MFTASTGTMWDLDKFLAARTVPTRLALWWTSTDPHTVKQRRSVLGLIGVFGGGALLTFTIAQLGLKYPFPLVFLGFLLGIFLLTVSIWQWPYIYGRGRV